VSEKLKTWRTIENLLGRQLVEVEPYAKDYALNPFAPKLPWLEFVFECIGIEKTEFARTVLESFNCLLTSSAKCCGMGYLNVPFNLFPPSPENTHFTAYCF